MADWLDRHFSPKPKPAHRAMTPQESIAARLARSQAQKALDARRERTIQAVSYMSWLHTDTDAQVDELERLHGLDSKGRP